MYFGNRRNTRSDIQTLIAGPALRICEAILEEHADDSTLRQTPAVYRLQKPTSDCSHHCEVCCQLLVFSSAPCLGEVDLLVVRTLKPKSIPQFWLCALATISAKLPAHSGNSQFSIAGPDKDQTKAQKKNKKGEGGGNTYQDAHTTNRDSYPRRSQKHKGEGEGNTYQDAHTTNRDIKKKRKKRKKNLRLIPLNLILLLTLLQVRLSSTEVLLHILQLTSQMILRFGHCTPSANFKPALGESALREKNCHR